MSHTSIGLGVVIGATVGSSYFSVFDKAEQRAVKLGAALKANSSKLFAAKEVGKYERRLQRLRGMQVQGTEAQRKLAAMVAKAELGYEEAAKSAKSYGLRIGDLARQTKQLSREQLSLQKTQGYMAGRQKWGNALGALKYKALAAAGVGYGFGRLAGGAMEREEQTLYLKTVINAEDGDSEAAIGRALEHAREFARNSLASEAEVLEIEYALNSAGLAEDVARAGTSLVHKLAKVTRGAPEQVGEIFGVTFNNLGAAMEGSTEEKMARIGNVLAKTQFKFQIRDFGQLGESMKYAAAGATAAKLPLEQTAAVIGQLNSAGLQGSMAGTAFNAVLRNLSKASEEIGFEVVRDDKGQLDLLATLEQLREMTDYLETDEKSDLFQKIFGDEGKRGVVPLLEQLDQLQGAYKDVQQAAQGDLVNEEYEAFLQSSKGQWQMLKQNVAQVGEVFAGTLLPALGLVSGGMAKLAGWGAKAINDYPIIGWIVGGVAVGFLGIGSALMLAAGAAWLWNAGALTLGGGLKLVTGAVKLLGVGMKLLSATMLTNPVFWVVGGVVALGTAVFLLWRNWDSVWGWITEKTAAFANWFKSWAPVVWVRESWQGVTSFFGNFWEGAKSLAGDAFGWLGDLFLNFTPLGLVIQHWQPILEFFGGLWDNIKEVFSAGVDWITGSVLAPIEAVKSTLGSAWDWVASDDEHEGAASLLNAASGEPGMLAKAWSWLGGDEQGGDSGQEQVAPNYPAYASVDLSAPVAPAAQTQQISDNRQYSISIAQQPGEDAQSLAERVMQLIEQEQERKQWGALADVY